jgi:hypothetical protein
VISAVTFETVRNETINVSGNITIAGSLTLIHSTVQVDRNITVTGSLSVQNASTIVFTTDGPGTNYLYGGQGSKFSLLDGDGDPSTPSDAALLTATPFAFNASFARNSTVTIRNSRVTNAGWSIPSPFDQRPGFRIDQAAGVDIRGSVFTTGFEAFIITDPTFLSIDNSSFDGFASALNITGGASGVLDNISLSNYTYGIRARSTVGLNLTHIRALSALSLAYDPPFAPPRGTAVAVDESSLARVANLEVDGPVGASAPRFITGFFVRNSTGVVLANTTGSWGDALGHIVACAFVFLNDTQASNFDQPLEISLSSNVTVINFHGTNERSGLQLRGSSDVAIRGLFVRNLNASALDVGASFGQFSLVGASATDSVGLATFTGNASAPTLQDLTLTNVSSGVLLTLTDGSGMTVTGVVARQVARSVIDASFTNVSGLSASDFDVDGVGGFVFNLTSVNASRLTFSRFSSNNTTLDVLHLTVTRLDNVTVTGFTANFHLEALVHVETNGVSDLAVRDLTSTNSSGILVFVQGGSIVRALISNLTLTTGNLPPPTGPPASIILDATGQANASQPGTAFSAVVDGLAANLSNRGGVYAAFALGGSLSVANLSLYSLQLDGVRVVSQGAAWNLTVTNVSYLASDAVAVHLTLVGGPSVTDIVAESGTAVLFDGVSNGRVQNVTHTGAYAALHIDQCSDVSGEMLRSVGGFAVDATGCQGLALANISVQASAWAVRVALSFDVTVNALVATNSGGGVAFLGVTRGTLSNTSLEFAGQGILVSQGSTRISLGPLAASSPPGETAGTFLQVSFGTFVSATQVSFSGRCMLAAQIQYSSFVDISHFAASVCGQGVVLATLRSVNVTDLRMAGTFAGSAFTVSDSTDVRLTDADLSRAADTAIFATDVDGFELRSIDASLSGGDGALLAFVANTSAVGLNLDGPSGACMRILYSPRNVTIFQVTARRGLSGLEVLASPNLLVEDLNASLNGGIGLYTDLLSPRVTLRNITATGNLWNGILVSANGTRLIDGNISGNGQAGIAVAPSIRLDWTIEGLASLTDEAIDLTGDLRLMPGSSLAVTRSNITVEQSARRQALEPYARIEVGPGATLALDRAALGPRDVRLPYSVSLLGGAHLQALLSVVTGGALNDGTSALNATNASILAVSSDFVGWYFPLRANGGSFDCSNCTYRQNRNGPWLSGATVTLTDFASLDNALDGLTVESSTLVQVAGATTWFNLGNGAVFDSIAYLRLTGFDALGNALSGLRVTDSNLSGLNVATSSSGGPGLVVSGGGAVSVAGLTSQSNSGGTGALFEDVADLTLAALDIDGNGGSGVELQRVGLAALSGGRIARSVLFGLLVVGSPQVSVEGVDFVDDLGANVRAESGAGLTLGNGSLRTLADYAVVLTGDAQAALVNLTLTGNVSGLLATDNSTALLLNSTGKAPTVLALALVRIGWFLRVLVQDSAGYPAPSTTVLVANNTNATFANASTGSGGATPLIPVIERAVRSAGRIEWFGPQAVDAHHPALGRARASLNITRYTALGLKLDNLTPTTVALAEGPRGQAGWFVGPPTVTFVATDDRAAGVSLFFRLGGGAWTQVQTDHSTASGSLRVDSEGRAQVEYYAVDEAGNAEAPATLEVPVDLTPPTAAFGALDPILFASPVALVWSGADGVGSGVVSFDVDYSLQGQAFRGWQSATTNRTGLFEAAEGSYQFRVVAHDAAGHTSAPAFVSARTALYGALRLRVVDAAGAPVPSVTVTVEAQNLTKGGSGAIEVAGLLPGPVRLRVTAPGFEPLVINANVTAGAVGDLQDVTLIRSTASGGFDLTAAYLVLAALVAVTAAYYLLVRRRWEHRRRVREREEKAMRDLTKRRHKGPTKGGEPSEPKPVEERADRGDGGGPDGKKGK